MKFFKVIFDGIPEITFAHSYETTSYRFHFSPKENRIEFSLVETGDVSVDYEDGTHQHFYAPYFHPSFYSQSHTSYSNAPFHRHITFGITAPFHFSELCENEVIQCWKSNFSQELKHPAMAIIPDVVTEKKTLQKIEALIQNIILNFAMHNNPQQLSCLSDFFSLLSVLTYESIRQATFSEEVTITPAETAYCNKASEYIALHLNEKISVGDIAGSLGISVGYFSRIFKSVTGYSAVDFINLQKISLAKQLLQQQKPISDIAELLGITDEKYFYRLFKKYTGMTTKKYREGTKEQYQYKE
ncbi:MAG: helix-turn-helix transcriptional regulator [Ruminococcaceae bacterium]|nr:helix-turn-helix transcriptional regulator [Oscillospiraceae bacterium]